MTKDQITDYEHLKEAVEKANKEREDIEKIINGVDGTGKIFSITMPAGIKDKINRAHIDMTIKIEDLLKEYKKDLNKLIESI